jgi:hypothetical protein
MTDKMKPDEGGKQGQLQSSAITPGAVARGAGGGATDSREQRPGRSCRTLFLTFGGELGRQVEPALTLNSPNCPCPDPRAP